MKKHTHIGGQALIEGVMIKSPKYTSAAVRKENGKIITRRERNKSLIKKYKILALPILRGVIYLGEMLYTGTKMLTWSADQQTDEGDEMKPWQLWLTVLISILATIVIFVVIPYYLTKIFIKEPTLAFNALDGVFRVAIFVGYIYIISLFKDIHRVFQYHGAEHMAVACYENDKALTVKNVRKYSKEHPRCGTSFIIIVIVLSIIIFSLIKYEQWYYNLPLRILVVPLLAGFSYELLKFSAKYKNSKMLGWAVLPGLWVQKITTKKPSAKQIEVAIAAVKKAL